MGNLSDNLRICGIVIVLIATFIPFEYMDDLISAGVLFLFSLTDCCLLTIRYKSPSESFLGENAMGNDERSSYMSMDRTFSVGNQLVLINAFSFASGLSFAYCETDRLKYFLSAIFAILTWAVTFYIARCCQESDSTHYALEGDGYGTGRKRFRTPFVPYLPAFGIFLNSFMMAHIHWVGLVMLAGYLFIGITGYAFICSKRKKVNSRENDNEINQSVELS